MLEINDIDVYYGASQALKKVSTRADKGKITAVLGRNGVGKTTLMQCVAGHVLPVDGSISWQGKPIINDPAHLRARHGIAYVPQGRQIFPLLTVQENLETGYACVSRKHRVIDPEIFDLFPVLHDMRHRRGGDLSGGQQQQLAIARALITRPELLILDEPTEGIQPSIIKDIQQVIAMLRDRGDMAILLVEQYFEFACELADNFTVLDRGEVVLEGEKDKVNLEQVRAHIMV
ncbi:urea ABC transporter ATP-binding subunit UrtE [Parendozoicomonas haliclonae]|uniref:High-affinity branched-chain amino acid transport ATP-binding protein LivF n=1 Tax=Parendozoicomonas haliclonae TaxID=1960125 RepID=A0A1X7AHT3_9GAMM|nr:urea ABC transporter ATP-binding subunit UrtE [Parendozoicomonas haliclonae]SMA41681.1 High-affinity branched-chain amino acid transport ATP-binding protein LivF [Parendozoicomonas haliclonae]